MNINNRQFNKNMMDVFFQVTIVQESEILRSSV